MGNKKFTEKRELKMVNNYLTIVVMWMESKRRDLQKKLKLGDTDKGDR